MIARLVLPLVFALGASGCADGERTAPGDAARGSATRDAGRARERAPTWAPSLAVGWTELQAPPFARPGAVTVWTGRELVYWGGETSGGSATAATSGAVLDPTRGWRRLRAAPIPARAWAAAVWTGDEVLVWGGSTGSRHFADGAAYDPERATWRRLPDAPLSQRAPVAAVWTGRELVVWGSTSRFVDVRDGAAYDPKSNRWRRIADAPFALNQASAVWTGDEVIVFGARLDGYNHAAAPSARGLAYNPEHDRWRVLPDQPLSPQASAVAWTGGRLVAWDYLLKARAMDAAGRWHWLPPLPLRPAECYPETVALEQTVFAWYCGQAAELTASGIWQKLDPPVASAELVAADDAVLLIGASEAGPRLFAYRPSDEPAPVALVSMPPKRLAHCRRSPVLRPACPTRVPVVDGGWYLSHLADDGAGPFRFEVFDLEHGGERPGRPEWNRPPRMVHLVLAGGAIERVSPSGDPDCKETFDLEDGLMAVERPEPVCFGKRAIGAHVGDLFLAPAFPTGGMLGNHLVFRWRENDVRYSLSLHGWEPLTEAANVLEQIAVSIERTEGEAVAGGG